MTEIKKNITSSRDSADFSFADFIKVCCRKWVWIAVCLCCAIGISLFYIYKQQPHYKRFEQILVNDQDNGGGLGNISNSFSNLGLFSKNSNVYNELIALSSPAIMYEVVDSLRLYMNYTERRGLGGVTLYGTNQPYVVSLPDVDSQSSVSMRIKTNPDGSKKLYKFVSYENDKKIKHSEKIELKSGETTANTPLGRIIIDSNPLFIKNPAKDFPEEIDIDKMAIQTAVEVYQDKLEADLADLDADVIELAVVDESTQRATDILNYILIIYNQNWIEDKNRMAVATSAFIDDRLKVIQSELGNVDETIAGYRKKTGTPDLKTAMQVTIERGSKLDDNLMSAENQLSMAKYMKEFLENQSNSFALLPINLGMESADLASQVKSYNDLLNSRNNIVNSSSESNPLVLNYDERLREMKRAIQISVNNKIASLETTVSALRKEAGKMNTMMANAPEVNLPLLSEERQQAVKQALYLFLLQKREETELSQKFTADNIRIITPPTGPLQPVAPRKALIIIVAGILGIGIPIVLIYYLEINNNKILSKQDLDSIDIPFAGEIPLAGKRNGLKALKSKLRKAKNTQEEAPLALVGPNKRDVINEAFRVVRGNLDFMRDKSLSSTVIMLTSFNPGSGKSFIAYNLAAAYALKNKRVLLVDCDLRHGSASLFAGAPFKGLTSYLTGESQDWTKLLVTSDSNHDLSIMPIGKTPPNPAELLENGKLDQLVTEAKNKYDIILLDCPPVNIVADTQLISPLADITLFVIRAGMLPVNSLKELEEFYANKKFKNLSIILNGTDSVRSRYYTYGNYQQHS